MTEGYTTSVALFVLWATTVFFLIVFLLKSKVFNFSKSAIFQSVMWKIELRKNGLGPNAPPVEGKWMHGALLKFHENYAGGKRLKFLGDSEIKV